MRLDAGVREPDETHRRLEPELVRRLLSREQTGRRAVGEARRVACRHTSADPEGCAQRCEGLDRRPGAEELVSIGDPPPLVPERRHRHDGAPEHPVRPRPPGVVRTTLALRRVAVGVLARELGERVVEVLRCLSHHGGALVDQALGHEAGIEVDLLAHRVMAHVLDAAGDREVARAEGDLAGGGRRRGQRTGAHPVDREPGDGMRQAGEDRDVAAQGQPLVADLGGGGEDDVADPLRRNGRVAGEHLPDDLNRHVVGARAGEEPGVTCAPERGSHTVDEDDLSQRPGHRRRIHRA